MNKRIKPDYICEECGATADSPANECCDYCLLSLFSGEYSPDLGTALFKYTRLSDWTRDKTDYSPKERAD